MDLDLTQPDQLVPLLQKYGLYTQKSFGQHFLVNRNILESIIQAADIQPSDTVIEVGAGTGVLTRELAARSARVITFEIDLHLNQLLAETLSDCPNVELHFEDFLKVSLSEVLEAPPTSPHSSVIPAQAGIQVPSESTIAQIPGQTLPTGRQTRSDQANIPHPDYKFVANLPYNAGTHILDILIKSPVQPQSITVLLQKEVAQKITARPPHAAYLSNFIALYGQALYLKTVKSSSFFPAPAVDSALLHVDRSPFTADSQKSINRQPSTVNPHAFSRLLHRGFAQPRKMLNKAFEPELLALAHIDPHQRPENLGFEDWLSLFEVIQSQSNSE